MTIQLPIDHCPAHSALVPPPETPTTETGPGTRLLLTDPGRIAANSPATTTSCGTHKARHPLSAILMQSRDTLSAKWPQTPAYLRRSVVTRFESRHKLGKIEAVRHNVRGNVGSGTLGKPGVMGRLEGNGAVVSRLMGAITRALLIAGLVLAPSMLVPGLSPDAQQTVALVALFAALLTFVEYRAEAPGLIEFRDAAPFNRTRFLLLAATILALSTVEAGRIAPTTFSQLIEAVGLLIGTAMDFPYSPVRLATQALQPGASEDQIAMIRSAAGLSYLIALLGLCLFTMLLRDWPGQKRSFNVWVNLPTFDPTSGTDVVLRLERDARINLALGFLLPFITPALVRFAMGGLDPQTLSQPHTMIWVMAAWSFLPASLFMRGIAMQRIAALIRAKRRASETALSGGYATA
jgi:hypothetical protein